MTEPIRLKSLRARVYRAPIETPVTTSFGIMRDRPMVLVEVEDHDGHRGFGEVWCNFPQVGAEHRARLVESVLAPLALARPFDEASQLFRHLTAATEVLAIQSGIERFLETMTLETMNTMNEPAPVTARLVAARH